MAIPDSAHDTSWVHDAVFYGIDIARFCDSNGDGFGDFEGLISKLDYLQGLGVTCLWLLPFYPSDRRDNGYDITEYLGVDHRFGGLEDFRRLGDEAHARGIRLMLDLVVHHTSAQHPWFEAAQTDPGSRYRDFYFWSKQKPPDDESKSVFPEEEHGIWTFSERAQEWYRHRFYHFEPDLHLANDEVWSSVKGVIDFWIALGADGFRVDAATNIFAGPGNRGGGSLFDERLDDLREYLRERSPSVALLGEADVRSNHIGEYFENERFQLLYNFLGNNALYLSLVRESADAIVGTMNDLRDTVASGAYLNFVRNLDELDLEQLTEDERDEVFSVLAPQEDMRIYGRGIRRGWAPMMRSAAQLRMTMSLLFALPGVPLLMYGQEIGMGDDLSRVGRDTVRLPMQWNASRTGGFSAKGHSGITRAAIPGGRHGFKRVNVERQQDDPESLLSLVRDLTGLKARFSGLGRRDWEVVDAGRPEVLVIRYRDLIAVHNLSRRGRRLPRLDYSEHVLGADISGGRIPAYGYAWLLR